MCMYYLFKELHGMLVIYNMHVCGTFFAQAVSDSCENIHMALWLYQPISNMHPSM